MSMSSAAVQAALAQETSDVFLVLAEIRHEQINGVLRFVDNTEDITSGGSTYTAVGFKFIPPSVTEDADTPAKLVIDSIDRAVMEVLIPIDSPLRISFRIVLSSSPDTTEWESGSLYLRNITADEKQISGDLYDMYIADRKIPGLYFTPFDFPGLF